MSDPYLGEIRAFAFDYAPKCWAQCDGSMLPVNQNPYLFSILRFRYGGDAPKQMFALPNMLGRVPMHPGCNPHCFRDHRLADMGGTRNHALSEVPPHTHTLNAVPVPPSDMGPEGNLPTNGFNLYAVPDNLKYMAESSIGPAGAKEVQPHDNMQPYIVVNFCICMRGHYPPHSQTEKESRNSYRI